MNSIQLKTVLIGLMIFSSIFSYAQIKINEISAFEGLLDEDDENSDWFEIYNTGAEIVDLSGFTFSDDPNEITQWTLPNGTIGPNQYRLIFASGKDRREPIDHWETVVYNSTEWRYFLGVENPPSLWYLPSFNDNSWNEDIGGIGFGDSDDNTIIGNVNSLYLRTSFTIVDTAKIQKLVLHADYDDGYIAYLNGIEIARSYNVLGDFPDYNNGVTEGHEANLYLGEQPDAVFIPKSEISTLFNEGANTLAIHVLNQSTFSTDISSNFYLSAGIIDDSNNYDVVPFWFQEVESNFHTNFKLSPGETLNVYNQNGILQDQKFIGDELSYGLSTGRSPDGIGAWCVFDEITPEFSNNGSTCYSGTVSQPTINLESGYYNGTQTLTIEAANANDFIRYTNNGDVPTINSTPYINPIVIDENRVVSVRVFSNENMYPSQVLDRTFFIDDQNHNLPVFSVFTDSLNLWDWDTGIYVDGPNADLENYPYYGANFWEPWSVWSRLEYFDRDGIKQAEESFDLEIHGGWSRANPQKSFRFDFKSEYSGDLEYPIIPDKPYITSYNNINVRNGGQHLENDKIQDAFYGRLLRDTDLDYMAYEPVLLFLNGDYWGIYGIREKIDENYVESNYLIDKDDVDLLAPAGALAGSMDHFVETNELLIGMDPDQEEFFTTFNERFDVLNYTDYFIAETYSQNLDWMGVAWGFNNTKLWHPQTEDGKWKYIMYDTDGSFGFFWDNINLNFINLARNPVSTSLHSEIFNQVLLNEEYKHYFVNRYADLMNTIYQPAPFSELLNTMKADLDLAMPEHIGRWGVPMNVGFWEESIQTIIDYNAARLITARVHVNEEFNLDGQEEVILDISPAGAGRIQISTISPDEYPWSGIYYNGCPVEITAIPNPGFVFDHWEPNEFWTVNNASQAITIDVDEAANFVAVFEGESQNASIEISEINYHSHASIDAGDWIELHNTSDLEVDISGWEITDFNIQFTYEFPANSTIPVDGYLVLVKDSVLFQAQHPGVSNFVGNFDFNLSNGGESIFLKNHLGEEFLSFTYNNNDPWPQGANGYGRTLELLSAQTNYNNPASWFDGCMGGSPGTAYIPCSPGIVFSEINYNSLDVLNPNDWVELKNLGNTPVDLSGWKFSDGNEDNVYTIEPESNIPVNGHLVLTRNSEEFNAVYSCHELGLVQGDFSFGLSSNNESLLLFDQNSTLVYSMHYKSESPWPTFVDGNGLTLELDDPYGNLNDGQNWFGGCPLGSPSQDYDPTCSQSLQVEITYEGNTFFAEGIGGNPGYEYQWYLNDEEIGAGNSLVINQNGICIVVVTDANGCEISSSPFYIQDVAVGSEEIPKLTVVPNPFQDQFFISGLLPNNSKIRIHNLQGELVKESLTNGKKNMLIHGKDLSAGIYLLTYQSEVGMEVVKLIKE